MGRLFGTDGIRGAANEYPLTAEVVEEIGRAVASVFKGANNRAKIIIAKDTRLSGDMIEDALAAGICSAGGEVYLAGILPTPAVEFWPRKTSLTLLLFCIPGILSPML